MVPSRRRLLALLATASVPLTGCNRIESPSNHQTPTPTPTESADDPSSGDRSLPPYAYLRHEDDAPIVRHVDVETPDGDRYHPDSYVVDSAKRARRFEYADVDGVESVRAFVDDTDFATETVFVDQRTVQSCYRLELCGISWTESSVDLEFARVPLPYDVPCEADAEVLEARFVRIPDTIDHESITSWGSSTGSHGCPIAPEPVAGSDRPGSKREGTTTGDGTTGSSTTAGNETNGSSTTTAGGDA